MKEMKTSKGVVPHALVLAICDCGLQIITRVHEYFCPYCNFKVIDPVLGKPDKKGVRITVSKTVYNFGK